MKNKFEDISTLLNSQKEKLKKLLLTTQKIIPELQNEKLESAEVLINEKKQILSGSDEEISTLKDYISKWDELKKNMSTSEVEKIQSSAAEVSNMLTEIITLENDAINKIAELRDKRAEELKNLMRSSSISDKYKKPTDQHSRFVDDES